MSSEYGRRSCPCHGDASVHVNGESGATWPRKSATSEAELFRGYGRVGLVTPTPAETVAVERRRRPSPLRSGDKGGPASTPLRIATRGAGPGAPIRLVILAPSAEAILPYLRFLRQAGWRVIVIGRAAYARHPGRPDLPGWLIGFSVDGEERPPWLRWLTVQRSRIAGDEPVRAHPVNDEPRRPRLVTA
jgi:hypothetical protein